jgi:inorganic pyrophosphatase/exopolyphosphatase
MGEVLVIGHRNPQRDAICSALDYAGFKRRHRHGIRGAARSGDTNDAIADEELKTGG